ncbi:MULTISPECIES: oligosaccharide flippase family protein [Phenylobacterium]|uniref:O-antigen/teichoic acid export membrane protein n=1 Tax=Phenylobacterium koreense TaxID=266125 RepID=A0ABV2EKQ2_9CAUL
MSTRRSLVWMAAAQAGYFVFQFGGSVILARLLSPHDMGVFAIALAVAGLLALIQAFGLSNLIIREAELKPALAATAFTMNAVLGLVMAALTVALGLFGGALLSSTGVAQVLLVLAALPLISIFEFLPAARLEREGAFRTLAMLKAGRSAIAMGLTVALAFAGYSYMSLAWGQLAGAGFNLLALHAVAWRHASLRLSFQDWRAVSRFGGQMLAISGVNSLADRLAEILLGRIIDLAALGLYSRASSMFNLLWNNIHIVLARVLLVDFADLARRGVPFRERYLRVVAVMTGTLWPAFGGLAILSGPFINLIYGPNWLGAALPLSMLSIAAIILVSITMTWQVFVVSGETSRQARIEVVRSGFGLALFCAGAFVSLSAAAAAKIGDALFSYTLYRPHLRRMTGTTGADLRPIYVKSGLVAAVAVTPAAILMIAYRGAASTPLLYVGASVVIGLVLWLGALRLTRHPLQAEIAVTARKLLGASRGVLKAAP